MAPAKIGTDMPKLTIRELLMIVAIVGVSIGWSVDHHRLEQELTTLKIESSTFTTRRDEVQAIPLDEVADRFSLLVYALTDPDTRVAIEADRKLREWSGLFHGFGDIETQPLSFDRLEVIRNWIEFYQDRLKTAGDK